MERGKLWRTAFGGNGRLLELSGVGLQPVACSYLGQLGTIRPLHGLSGAI